MAQFRIDRASVRAASVRAAAQEMQIGARMVQNRAKILAPVDTGRLRASISKDVNSLSFKVFSNVEYAGYVNDGTRPHVIRPRHKQALRFRVGGRTVFAKEVHHPGTRAKPYLDRALQEVARQRGWNLSSSGRRARV
jgi:phage gpG-like protein